MFNYIFSRLAFAHLVFQVVFSYANPGCSISHTVVSGDSCWSIASSAGLTLSDLQNLNPDISCTSIFPGQHICLEMEKSVSLEHDSTTQCTAFLEPDARKACIKNAQQLGGISLAFNPAKHSCRQSNTGGTSVCTSDHPSPTLKAENAVSADFKDSELDHAINSSMEIPKMQARNSKCTKLGISVGYATSWAIWRKCMKVLPEDIDASAYTHIHFSFAGIDSNNRLVLLNEDDDKYLRQLVKHINTRYPRVKIIVAVGGWTFNEPGPTQFRFTNMVSTRANRREFIASSISLLQRYKANGIDIDWEYPTIKSRGGRANDADNLNKLMAEMHAAFRRKYSLSIAIPSAISSYLYGFKLSGLVPYVDYIVSMTYDMRGPFDYSKRTGGKLLAHNNMTDVRDSVVKTIQLGVPANKLLLGLAFYGRSYRLKDPQCSNPGCPFTDPSVRQADPGPCTGQNGFIGYNEISQIVSKKQFRKNQFDLVSLTNIITYGQNQWSTYDSPNTIRRRMDFAKQRCLAGTAVWAIDLDGANHQLSNTILQTRA